MFVCFFNATATTEIYTYCHTLSLHDALPISSLSCLTRLDLQIPFPILLPLQPACHPPPRDHAKRASSDARLTPPEALDMMLSMLSFIDRKSTRLNSSP